MSSIRYVVGVDEVGAGALAGPLVVAAVAFPADARRVTARWQGPRGAKTLEVNDSKKIRSAEHRAALDDAIRSAAAAWSVVDRSPGEIDEKLIRAALLEATALAISRCLEKLLMTNPEMSARSAVVLIDGEQEPPDLPCTVHAIPGGDASDWRIGAASIVAKAAHDQRITRLHERYPDWGLDRSRGYGTRTHKELLRERGPIAGVHRLSYAPVREARGKIAGLES